MLDHHRDRVARRIVRRIGDEQRVRPVLPRQLANCRNVHPPAARATRGAPATSRSCRPSASADRSASPAGAVPPGSFTTAHIPSRTTCSEAVGQIEQLGQSAALRSGLQLTGQLAGQMRLHRPAGGDARQHTSRAAMASPGCSPGRCRTRPCRRGSTHGPGDAPLARRDQAGARAGKVDLQFGAQSEAVRHRRDAVDPDPPCGLIEEHIATVLQAAAQIERAVATLAPAMKPRVAEVEIARTMDGIAGEMVPRLQSRPSPPPS